MRTNRINLRVQCLRVRPSSLHCLIPKQNLNLLLEHLLQYFVGHFGTHEKLGLKFVRLAFSAVPITDKQKYPILL